MSAKKQNRDQDEQAPPDAVTVCIRQSAFNFCNGVMHIKSLAIAKGLGNVTGVCSLNHMHRLALSKERNYFFLISFLGSFFLIVESML